MSGLHAPTVPSGPTAAPTSNGNARHLSFTELQRKKENLELELKALGSVLESVCLCYSLVGHGARRLTSGHSTEST